MKGEPPLAFDFYLLARAVLDAADAGLEDIRKRDIEEMDLSPLVVREFVAGVVLREPLWLTPMLSEDGELLRLEFGELGIDVFAPTRRELQEELAEQLGMLWAEFALEADEKLSEPATELKKRLWNRTTLSAGHGAS